MAVKQVLALDLETARKTYGSFVSYTTASELLAVSPRTLKRLTDDGQLPVFTVGRSRTYRLRIEDVVGLMRRVA